MKLVSFNYRDRHCIGVVDGEGILFDFEPVFQAENITVADMKSFINLGERGLALAGLVLDGDKRSSMVDEGEIRWLPPVTDPGKICGVALNNSASNSRKISAPDHPAFFLKPPSCLAAHKQPLLMRTYYGSMHPEPEVAVIIGKKARDVAAVAVDDYIFGYAIFNDITGNGMRAEDLFHYQALYASDDDPTKIEKREQHLSYAGRYKGTDNFGVLGPWLVTKDEVGDPNNLAVSCRVAGEVVAEDNTRYYNYKIAEIVSYISQFQTLNPGDIVSCGTAFKPAAGRKSIHHANFLVTGGPVEIEVEKLGRQYNPIVIEERAMGKWRLA